MVRRKMVLSGRLNISHCEASGGGISQKSTWFDRLYTFSGIDEFVPTGIRLVDW
jgi:hypothetical protein